MDPFTDQIYRYGHYIGVAIAAALVCQQIIYRIIRIPRNLRHIPAVSYLKLLYSILTNEPLTARTNRLVYPLLLKANGLYLVRHPFDWTVYVANPILARTVLFKPEFTDKTTSIIDKTDKNNPIVLFVGNDNLVITSGEKWKHQRKVINPVFHRAVPVAMFGSLTAKTFAVIESQGTVNAIDLTHKMSLDVLGMALFGFDFRGLQDPESTWIKLYTIAFEDVFDVSQNLFLKLFKLYRMFTSKEREKREAILTLINLLDKVADEKRAQLIGASSSHKESVPDNEKDLMTLMLEAELRGEGSWTKQELRHNIGIFFFAGQHSTRNALSFCLYHLAVNPGIQAKARQELLDLFGDEPVDVFPTLEDIKKLNYLDMIIKENLRMYAPANDILSRIVKENVELGGVIIPKGSLISIDIHALHHNPDVWHDPETFDPERFRPGGEHDQHEGMTFVPFSSGARQCIAVKFVMMEQRVFLAMLLRKFEWELAADSEHRDGLKFDCPFNFVPKSLDLTFHKRY